MSVIIECSFECIFWGKGKSVSLLSLKRDFIFSQPCFHVAGKPSASLSTSHSVPSIFKENSKF